MLPWEIGVSAITGSFDGHVSVSFFILMCFSVMQKKKINEIAFHEGSLLESVVATGPSNGVPSSMRTPSGQCYR